MNNNFIDAYTPIGNPFVLISVILIIFGICLILIVNIIVNRSNVKYHEANTYVYRHYEELNKLLSLCDLNSLIEHKSVDTLSKFNSYNKDKWFREHKENIDFFTDLVYQLEINSKHITNYKKLLIECYDNINIDFQKKDKKLLRKFKSPLDTDYMYGIAVSYVSPAGRNRYNKVIYVSISDIKQFIEQLNNIDAKKQERSKMTQKMRYNVLIRDDYKCAACGASINDGVKLEVDHIVPIAKGGKTVYSNLITLCFDCNRGKSDDDNDIWIAKMSKLAIKRNALHHL